MRWNGSSETRWSRSGRRALCLTLCALATACGSDRYLTKTQVVVLKTDDALLEPVARPVVPVAVNEDLDRKALRFEAALAECNARLEDVKKAQDVAVEQARAVAAPKDQPARPWWQRLIGR